MCCFLCASIWCKPPSCFLLRLLKGDQNQKPSHATVSLRCKPLSYPTALPYGASPRLASLCASSWCKALSCFLLCLLMVQAAILFPPATSYGASLHFVSSLAFLWQAAILFPLAPPYGASSHLASSCASYGASRHLVSSCASLWCKLSSCFLLLLERCKPPPCFPLAFLWCTRHLVSSWDFL
jgi:hypothetical protein